MAVTPIVVADLTEATLHGGGVFDLLMRASKEHLEQEFQKNRIKGGEYSSVYLGSLTAVLQQAVQFLLSKDKAANEAALVEAQIRLADAQVALAAQQLLNTKAEHEILLMGLPKINAEIAQIQAQTAMLEQQKQNAILEGVVLEKQALKITADIILSGHQGDKLVADASLTREQTANAKVERTVLVAQECKLRAEYDVLMQSKAKTAAENALLIQKVATEKAQISALGVDENSVIGKQVKLYAAQIEGYTRDAEQKAAKVMVDTWNVRRTTDDGTEANADNSLNDAAVGRAVTKLLSGVKA